MTRLFFMQSIFFLVKPNFFYRLGILLSEYYIIYVFFSFFFYKLFFFIKNCDENLAYIFYANFSLILYFILFFLFAFEKDLFIKEGSMYIKLRAKLL